MSIEKLVLSPDAVLRFRAGRAVVHNPYSAEAALETEEPAVLGLLMRFARPQDPGKALRDYPAGFRPSAERTLAQLRRSGVIVPSEGGTPPAVDGPAAAFQGLQALARVLGPLAAEIQSLESAAPDQSAALSLGRRVFALLAGVDAIKRDVEQARRAQVSKQLLALEPRFTMSELKLNVGAGDKPIAGWVNIDAGPADVTLNVASGLPLPDGCARLIYTCHMLEHLRAPAEVLQFLGGCRRVLRPGGRLRVVVPNAQAYLGAYVSRDEGFFRERRRTWNLPEGRTPLEETLAYLGVGADPGEFLHSHRSAFDTDTLHKLLRAAGFVHAEVSGYQASSEPELRVDEVSAVAGAQRDGQHYSLFMEALA